MIIRLLLLGVVLFVIYFIFFKDRRGKHEEKNTNDALMVECKKCGIYVSENEAIEKNEQYFCSKSCRDN